jgi:hypothetical protein
MGLEFSFVPTYPAFGSVKLIALNDDAFAGGSKAFKTQINTDTFFIVLKCCCVIKDNREKDIIISHKERWVFEFVFGK